MVNILIGCTGSVAAIKLPKLVEKLQDVIKDINIKVVVTENAKHFFSADEIYAQVYDDAEEWSCWSKIGDPVLHIDLRNWSDIFVLSPLDANTLGKLACGLCDNLLTCVARAWDLKRKPFLFCPAMNTFMWEHPSTRRNIDTLKEWGYIEIPPVSKALACGDVGVGAMAEIEQIVSQIQIAITSPSFSS
ncbi:unnamed protein product [Clavelina lepadiformis]|uniref:Flavoprotein domain-containing protein n=1 Tax=Clavelina lepadiformis TaxID=159417 RepID=A0ABP0F1X3_CLALP